MEPQTECDCHPFQRSREAFEAMTARLSSSGVLRLPHGELEELVQEEGREILRSLLHSPDA